jgi:hypothetical protein
MFLMSCDRFVETHRTSFSRSQFFPPPQRSSPRCFEFNPFNTPLIFPLLLKTRSDRSHKKQLFCAVQQYTIGINITVLIICKYIYSHASSLKGAGFGFSHLSNMHKERIGGDAILAQARGRVARRLLGGGVVVGFRTALVAFHFAHSRILGNVAT